MMPFSEAEHRQQGAWLEREAAVWVDWRVDGSLVACPRQNANENGLNPGCTGNVLIARNMVLTTNPPKTYARCSECHWTGTVTA